MVCCYIVGAQKKDCNCNLRKRQARQTSLAPTTKFRASAPPNFSPNFKFLCRSNEAPPSLHAVLAHCAQATLACQILPTNPIQSKSIHLLCIPNATCHLSHCFGSVMYSYTAAKKIEVIRWRREHKKNVHQTSQKFKLDRKQIREWEKNFDNLLKQNFGKAKLRRKLRNGVLVFSEYVDNALFKFFEPEKNRGTRR